MSEQDRRLDFLFGLAGNKALTPKAESLLAQARALHQEGIEAARRNGTLEPAATRLYNNIDYQADSWPKAYRVVLKAEVMALGENLRFVVTSITDPCPQALTGTCTVPVVRTRTSSRQ